MNGKRREILVTPSERELQWCYYSPSIFSRFFPKRPRPLGSFDTHARWVARNAKLSISMILRKNRGLWTVYQYERVTLIDARTKRRPNEFKNKTFTTLSMYYWLTVFSPSAVNFSLWSISTNWKNPHLQNESWNDFRGPSGQALPLPSRVILSRARSVLGLLRRLKLKVDISTALCLVSRLFRSCSLTA